MLIKTEALCCISVDIDAVAGWLGSYGGEDSTSDISRGEQALLATNGSRLIDTRSFRWYCGRSQASEAV